MNSSLTIMCLHGVGLWPGLFHVLDLASIVTPVTRPGYGAVPQRDDLAGQIQYLYDLIASEAPTLVVGVSGGATLALACAIRGAPGLIAVVSHEPLVGVLEPTLDERVRSAAEMLEAGPGPDVSEAFLEGLYGAQSWRRMPAPAREWARRHAETVCREVRHFTEFQPSLGDVTNLAVPHLTTVGARSDAARHRVAALLERGGSETAVIEGSGHHVLIDQPVTFARRISLFIEEVT